MDEEENYKFPEGDSIDDDPADEDIERFERNDFVRCARCKKYNHAEALTCRFCKYFLTEEDHEAPGRPLWMRIAIIIVLILAVFAAIFGFAGSDIHFDFQNWHP